METANKDNLFVPAKNSDHQIEDIQGSSLSFWQDASNRFLKNKASVISLVLLIVILLIAGLGPFISNPYEKNGNGKINNKIGNYQNVEYKYLPPRVPGLNKLGIMDGKKSTPRGGETDYYKEAGAEDYYFIFGTDELGRDLFVRTCVGTLISIAFGLIAALFDIAIGVTLGGISGYFSGKTDLALQRVVEILGTIPTLIWVMLFVLYFGAGFFPLVFAMIVSGWISMYRIVRGQVFKIKEQEFVLSSKTLGGSGSSIIKKHILPNTMSTIIIWLMFTIPSAIFLESFLSYIGLGIQVPVPSLGTLASSGKDQISSHPYIIFIPTMALALIMLSFNLIADGLRDAFDPKMRGGE